MQETHYNITVFLLLVTLLILILGRFILTVLFLYRKKQIAYMKELEIIKSEFERNLLSAQLEMQEQTFQNISREIHDHICLNLTLAKLNLVTIDHEDKDQFNNNINSSVEILGESIHELSDISHSLNPEIIESSGLITTLEIETEKMKKLNLFQITMSINGNPVYMDSHKELFIFRIIQEAFNNILKHAKAKNVLLQLYFHEDHIVAKIKDDGTGFRAEQVNENGTTKPKSGLLNMKKRAKLINGSCEIISEINNGTTIHLNIPY